MRSERPYSASNFLEIIDYINREEDETKFFLKNASNCMADEKIRNDGTQKEVETQELSFNGTAPSLLTTENESKLKYEEETMHNDISANFGPGFSQRNSESLESNYEYTHQQPSGEEYNSSYNDSDVFSNNKCLNNVFEDYIVCTYDGNSCGDSLNKLRSEFNLANLDEQLYVDNDAGVPENALFKSCDAEETGRSGMQSSEPKASLSIKTPMSINVEEIDASRNIRETIDLLSHLSLTHSLNDMANSNITIDEPLDTSEGFTVPFTIKKTKLFYPSRKYPLKLWQRQTKRFLIRLYEKICLLCAQLKNYLKENYFFERYEQSWPKPFDPNQNPIVFDTMVLGGKTKCNSRLTLKFVITILMLATAMSYKMFFSKSNYTQNNFNYNGVKFCPQNLSGKHCTKCPVNARCINFKAFCPLDHILVRNIFHIYKCFNYSKELDSILHEIFQKIKNELRHTESGKHKSIPYASLLPLIKNVYKKKLPNVYNRYELENRLLTKFNDLCKNEAFLLKFNLQYIEAPTPMMQLVPSKYWTIKKIIVGIIPTVFLMGVCGIFFFN